MLPRHLDGHHYRQIIVRFDRARRVWGPVSDSITVEVAPIGPRSEPRPLSIAAERGAARQGKVELAQGGS
jgi:hypothetical protein